MEIFASSMVSIITVVILLAIYSICDIRTRRVPNWLTIMGVMIGILVVSITGHFVENIDLHLVSLLFIMVISSILFKIGVVGGADYKALVMIAVISPGFELFSLGSPSLEAIIVSGFDILLMLVGGTMISRFRTSRQKHNKTTALIPILLCVYVVIQFFGLTLAIM